MQPPTASPSSDALLALLDRERAAFLAQVERVPGALQARRLAPDRWSVAEIVEHVARIDRGVGKLIALRSAQPVPATPEQLAAARLTPEMIARVRSRAERVEAPERVRPTGTLSPEDALEQLANARAALKAAFLAADPSVLDGGVHPHPVIGPVTIRGWVELAAHHDARHAQQIAELADEWAASRGAVGSTAG
jgi:DinB superfamily